MYRRDHTRLQERSYPFTGEIIPVYRRDHTRLQERSYPFTGKPISNHTHLQEELYPFTGQSYPFTGYRDSGQKNKELSRHTRLQEKGSPDHTRNRLTYGYDSYTLGASGQTEQGESMAK